MEITALTAGVWQSSVGQRDHDHALRVLVVAEVARVQLRRRVQEAMLLRVCQLVRRSLLLLYFYYFAGGRRVTGGAPRTLIANVLLLSDHLARLCLVITADHKYFVCKC